MPDNTYPQIPPNCEYFEIDRYFYFVLPNNSSWSIPLCNPGRWRPIIAAVAEVAWRREADRIERDGGWGRHCAEYMDARDAHRAWRKWGEPDNG